MTLKCLGSSSSGNGYILETPTEALLIECGKPLQHIKRALNWNVAKVAGCLVTHKHKDHSAHIADVARCGINVLALPEVFDNLSTTERLFCKPIYPMHGYKVGNFRVFAFDLQHANNDGTPCPCLGFVVEHDAMGKLLFVTDTMMLKYRFNGINHIMIEANYSDDILDYNIEQGITEQWQKPRLLASHLEVSQTAKILQSFDLTQVHNIILLHLSSRNSDPQQFKRTIEAATGKAVNIARSGLELNLSNEPY